MPAECVDGKWRYSEFDSLHELALGRKVRLPLYKFVNGGNLSPAAILDDQEPDAEGNLYSGRVIVDWCPGGVVTEEDLSKFGPTDVVQWPLYHGGPHPYSRGAGTGAKLPTYAENLSALGELCKRVPGIGILLGNCGGELAYHHLICMPDQRQREWCITRDVEFIRETGALVREAGGRPFWGPMEREVLIDCYHGGWRMGRAVQEFGGAMIVFQEGGLFPRWTMIYGNAKADGIWYDGEPEPHPNLQEWRDDYGVFVEWSVREPYPYPTLLAYFREFEVWHCIGYDREFLLGYDQLLERHGVKALVY